MHSVDHVAVVERVREDAGFDGRYAFMILMSAGIAMLGLLLSSPAVVIGAMLISPLMGPIIGLGFGLATFDWREIRRVIDGLGWMRMQSYPEPANLSRFCRPTSYSSGGTIFTQSGFIPSSCFIM